MYPKWLKPHKETYGTCLIGYYKFILCEQLVIASGINIHHTYTYTDFQTSFKMLSERLILPFNSLDFSVIILVVNPVHPKVKALY